MNRTTKALWLVAAVVALLVGGLGWLRGNPPPQGNISGSNIGGSLAGLVDQDRRPVTDQRFAGKYRLLYFGYTFCPDICPTDVALMVKGWRGFSGAAKVAPIFITVDPVRDTPATLKDFVRGFDPALTGLTGTPAQIGAVQLAYGSISQRDQNSDSANYLINHSVKIYLMGPTGAPIAMIGRQQDAAGRIIDVTAADVTVMLDNYVR